MADKIIKLLNGTDEKRTGSDGWVEFHNFEDDSGTIYVQGERMGDHSLGEG